MRSSNNYKLLDKHDSALIEVAFPKIAIVTASLPFLAFIFCILWSLLFNFVDSTSTHCHVSNYLPSVSAAVGSYAPQKYVWRICIALHSTPRYVVMFMYYVQFHRSVLILLLNWVEISCLLGLTFISSTENFQVHATSFTSFILANLLGMFITPKRLIGTPKSRKAKSFLRLTNMISIVFASYFYVRHNWHCEPGVYTLFALFEYIVVLSNIAYHFQAFHDFHDSRFIILN